MFIAIMLLRGGTTLNANQTATKRPVNVCLRVFVSEVVGRDGRAGW